MYMYAIKIKDALHEYNVDFPERGRPCETKTCHHHQASLERMEKAAVTNFLQTNLSNIWDVIILQGISAIA